MQRIDEVQQGHRVATLELDLRATMRRVATAVAVVTTSVGGRPMGTTVSAFDSLSMTPPMITVALQESSSFLASVRPGARLGVNVLAADQSWIAERFAARIDDRYRGVDWRLDSGAPRLRGVHAWVVSTVRDLVPGGDHVVLVCDVVAAAPGSGAPLIYHDRRYGTYSAA